MKALVIGASGSTGKALVEELCNDNDFSEIIVFVRRKLDFDYPKITTIIVDFDQMDSWSSLVKGDAAFSCLGTTLKDAGSKQAQWKIDFDYQYEFAKVAKENNVDNFVLVSAAGASSQSKLFYPRMKGELEVAIKKLNIKSLSILKPGMLNRPNTQRSTEKLILKALNFLNNLGLLKSQKALPTATLAKAMVLASKQKSKSYQEIKGQEIFLFAEQKL